MLIVHWLLLNRNWLMLIAHWLLLNRNWYALSISKRYAVSRHVAVVCGIPFCIRSEATL